MRDPIRWFKCKLKPPKKGLPAPVTVILYATFPEIMTIDQARNVRLEIKDKFAQRRERN